MICTDALRVPGSSVTRCGHVFHTSCLQLWFNQKQVCPLCKTICKAGSTRELRAPVPIEPVEEARMRALAGAGADVAAVSRQLQSQVRRLESEIEKLWEVREEEEQRARTLRGGTHRLQSQLLNLKRELTAAWRMEEVTAAVPIDFDAIPLPLDVDVERSVSREAVAQQSKQIAWRCQELYALDQKISEAKAKIRRFDSEQPRTVYI